GILPCAHASTVVRPTAGRALTVTPGKPAVLNWQDCRSPAIGAWLVIGFTRMPERSTSVRRPRSQSDTAARAAAGGGARLLQAVRPSARPNARQLAALRTRVLHGLEPRQLHLAVGRLQGRHRHALAAHVHREAAGENHVDLSPLGAAVVLLVGAAAA